MTYVTARVCAAIFLATVAAMDNRAVTPARNPNETANIIVAQDGTGDYGTIQAALDSIPAANAANRTILIRNGSYREKVLITVSHVALVGEDREHTRIEYSELRRNWRKSHPDDWGAAVINIQRGIGTSATKRVTTGVRTASASGKSHTRVRPPSSVRVAFDSFAAIGRWIR